MSYIVHISLVFVLKLEEKKGAMVTMNHLSVEDPDDESPLLPEAVEAVTLTPIFHRKQVVRKTDVWGDFFLSRYISAGRIYGIILIETLLTFFLPCTGVRTSSSVWCFCLDAILLF